MGSSTYPAVWAAVRATPADGQGRRVRAGLFATALFVMAAGCTKSTERPPPAPIVVSQVSPPSPAAQAQPAAQTAQTPPQHSVIAHLRLSQGKFGGPGDVEACQRLETELETDIVRAQAGEMDGNEIGEGECILYMYGPDADRLWATIEARVRAATGPGRLD